MCEHLRNLTYQSNDANVRLYSILVLANIYREFCNSPSLRGLCIYIRELFLRPSGTETDQNVLEAKRIALKQMSTREQPYRRETIAFIPVIVLLIALAYFGVSQRKLIFLVAIPMYVGD